MKPVAAILLALVAVTHYGGDLIALQYASPGGVQRSIYYVLRSFEGAVQYALIALLALALAAAGRKEEELSLWVGKAKEPGCSKGSASAYVSAALVCLVCGWGLAEHLQAGACRLAIGVENKQPPAQPLVGLCDDLIGLPMYALGLCVAAFLAAVIAAYSWESRNA